MVEPRASLLDLRFFGVGELFQSLYVLLLLSAFYHRTQVLLPLAVGRSYLCSLLH